MIFLKYTPIKKERSATKNFSPKLASVILNVVQPLSSLFCIVLIGGESYEEMQTRKRYLWKIIKL